MRQRVTRHETTVAPPPYPDTRAINVRLVLQPRQTVLEISQLKLAKVLINRPRRFESLTARSAIVTNPDDVTLLGQQLVKHVRLRAPTISDLRRVWATVGKTHHRILLARVEVGRFDHQCFHFKPIARLHLQQLGRSEFVLLECVNFVLRDDTNQFPRAIEKTNLRRCIQIAPDVEEIVVCRTEIDAMSAFGLRQPRQTRAVELDAIRMWCDGTMLRRREVNETVVFVDTLNGSYFPLAVGYLAQQFSVGRIVIK